MMEAVRATLCSSTDSLANRHTTRNSNFAPGLVTPRERIERSGWKGEKRDVVRECIVG